MLYEISFCTFWKIYSIHTKNDLQNEAPMTHVTISLSIIRLWDISKACKDTIQPSKVGRVQNYGI